MYSSSSQKFNIETQNQQEGPGDARESLSAFLSPNARAHFAHNPSHVTSINAVSELKQRNRASINIHSLNESLESVHTLKQIKRERHKLNKIIVN